MSLRDRFGKKDSKLLRELACEAHERELAKALAELAQSFKAWEAGEISAGELSHRVHTYEQGPSRDLFKIYNYQDADFLVSGALVRGVLKEDDIPADLLEKLSPQMTGLKSFWEDEDSA